MAAYQTIKEQKNEQIQMTKLSEEHLSRQAEQASDLMEANQELHQTAASLDQQIRENADLLFRKMGSTDVKAYHAPGEKTVGLYDNFQPQSEKHLKQKQERKKHFRKAQKKAVKQLNEQLDLLEKATLRNVQGDSKEEQEHFHQTTLTNMMASITLATELPMDQREPLMRSAIALQTQAKSLFKRFARTSTILKMKNLPSALVQEYQKRWKTIQAERAALDKQVDKFAKNQYQKTIPFLTTTVGHGKRFRDRSRTYAQQNHCKLGEACAAILQRSVVPATLEKHQSAREAWLNSETFRESYPTKHDSEAVDAVFSHEDQMSKLMNELKAEPKYASFTQQEVEEASEAFLKRAVEDSDFRFRCSAESFGLIADDKLRSQMEVGTSAATFDPEYRMRYAYRHFGVEMGSIDASEYETYGYLASKDITQQNNQTLGEHPTDMYGEVAVKLNRERMKNRVTMTVGDSLQGYETALPELVDHPTINCTGEKLKAAIAKHALDARIDPKLAEKPIHVDSLVPNTYTYLELQFHGDVTARDIDEVTFVYPAHFKSGYVAKERKMQFKEKALRLKAKVKDINENPGKYGRTAEMGPIVLKILTPDHKVFTQ